MIKRQYLRANITIIGFIWYSIGLILFANILLIILTIPLTQMFPDKASTFAKVGIYNGTELWIGLIAYVVILGLFLGLHISRRKQYNKYMNAINTQAHLQGWKTDQSSELTKPFEQSTLLRLRGINTDFDSMVQTESWQYATYSYDIYTENKSGKIPIVTMRYGVMLAKLSRHLPNVFLDSQYSRGQQFKKLFDPKQQHDLEGDFSTYFKVYFPESYEIDSLSFITPEVMQIMKLAAEYDIEIINDTLFLYGPLYLSADPLGDMAKKLLSIKQALEDNIDTYRDNRLPNELATEFVTPIGMKLKPRRVVLWSLYIVALYFIVRIVLMLIDS